MNSRIEETYRNYKKELKIAEKFYTITSYSYDLCTSLKDEDISFDPKLLGGRPDKNQSSYTPAEVEYNSVLSCEWVSLSDFSKREKLKYDDVEAKAENGEYGEVVENDGQKYIIWPTEYQFSDEKPEFGKKLFSVEVKQKIAVTKEISGENLKGFIKTYFKDLDKTTSDAQEILNRETFLLYWSAFEQYVKQMALVLFELFPEEVFKNKKYGKETMSLLDIYVQSKKFTDISELSSYILGTIIGNSAQGNKDSISKTIQFIRDCFMEKSDDPYTLWYVFHGERCQTSFIDVDNIRNIRNALVHENGGVSGELKSNSLYEEKNGTIFISNDTLERELFILKTVGYNLFNCVDKTAKKK